MYIYILKLYILYIMTNIILDTSTVSKDIKINYVTAHIKLKII